MRTEVGAEILLEEEFNWTGVIRFLVEVLKDEGRNALTGDGEPAMIFLSVYNWGRGFYRGG